MQAAKNKSYTQMGPEFMGFLLQGLTLGRASIIWLNVFQRL